MRGHSRFPATVVAREKHVAVGEYDALGVRGSTAGEQNFARIIGRKGARLVKLGVFLAYQVGKQRVTHNVFVGLGTGNNNAFGKPSVGANLIIQLNVARLYHRALDVAHIQRIFALRLKVLLVHGNHHGADFRQAEHAHQEFGRGVHLHCNAFAADNALAQEHIRRLIDHFVEQAIPIACHFAILSLENQELFVTAFTCEFAPKACKRFIADYVNHANLPFRAYFAVVLRLCSSRQCFGIAFDEGRETPLNTKLLGWPGPKRTRPVRMRGSFPSCDFWCYSATFTTPAAVSSAICSGV